MKVIIATEKPFAAAAVEGIKKEMDNAGNEVVLLEKYAAKTDLLDAVKDADAMIVRSDKIDKEELKEKGIDVPNEYLDEEGMVDWLCRSALKN